MVLINNSGYGKLNPAELVFYIVVESNAIQKMVEQLIPNTADNIATTTIFLVPSMAHAREMGRGCPKSLCRSAPCEER